MRIEVHFVSGAIRIYNFRNAPHTISWGVDEGNLNIQSFDEYLGDVEETDVSYFITIDGDHATKYERQTHSDVENKPEAGSI